MFADGVCCDGGERHRSLYCGGMALIPYLRAVCKKCFREVTRDRVLRDRCSVLST